MIKKEIEVTRVYESLENSTAEINIFRGGTGSSKSYSAAQFFILKKLCGQTGKIIVIARKTLPALRKTAYRETVSLLDKYSIPYKENKTELEYKINGNILYFLSVDNPEKIKSLNTDDVWLEEPTEFTLEDFMQFYLRLQGQIYLTFNPIDANHWIKTEIIDSGTYDYFEDVSTYKDNPFLPERRKRKIENLINQDQNYYRIYACGEWGILKNIIYDRWSTFRKVKFKEDVKHIDGKKVDDITYGLDFGYSNPSALTEINWIENDFIAHELLYQDKLTNDELIERVKKIIPEEERYREIYADHSEPDRINEFYHAGFNIHKARKDVTAGIDFCKAHMLGITASSVNGIKELQSYKRREDKDGNVMEEPLKFNDHFCDSMRYGAYSKLNVTGDSRIADFSFR